MSDDVVTRFRALAGDELPTERWDLVRELWERGEWVPDEVMALAYNDQYEFQGYIGALQVLVALGDRAPLDVIAHSCGYLSESYPELRDEIITLFTRDAERAPADTLATRYGAAEALEQQIGIIRALERLGENAPVTVISRALKASEGEIPVAALNVTARMKAGAPLAEVVAALRHSSASVRVAAVAALGALARDGVPVEAEAILPTLHDRYDMVRREGARALAAFGPAVALQHLQELAAHDTDQYVRGAAVSALGLLGDAVPADYFLALVDGDDSSRAYYAVEVVGSWGERAPIEKLAATALWHPEWLVRVSAMRALGNLGARAPQDALMTALGDAQYMVREEAAKSLARQGDRAPIEPLLKLLADSDADVARVAGVALGSLGSRVPLDQLAELMKAPETRLGALTVIGALRGQVAPEAIVAAIPVHSLVPLLYDAEYKVRHRAAEALGACGLAAPVEPLIAMLGDSWYGVRSVAADVLASAHPEALLAVAPEAEALLTSGRYGAVLGSLVRGFVITLVETAGTPANTPSVPPVVVEQLIELLDWPHWETRLRAAQAIGQLRYVSQSTEVQVEVPPSARARLQALADAPDEVPAVRAAATKALERFPD